MQGTDLLQLVECPRDAMQGWPAAIATTHKVNYINALLKVGFHTIDFGSFVSPKAIPQMADTREVLAALDNKATRSALLAIVANARGAEEAVSYGAIRYLGFPFSVSATFQQKNTNSSIEEALVTVEKMQSLCLAAGKELVVYLSMGFGNPYGDPWSAEMVINWAGKLATMGIGTISLADTVGLARPQQVREMIACLIDQLPGVSIGVHLHANPGDWRKKVEAAFQAGCRRFDGALKGIGGCPMAGNELVGNIDTMNLVNFFGEQGIETGINREALEEAWYLAGSIFNHDA